jgi:hypothetical protein
MQKMFGEEICENVQGKNVHEFSENSQNFSSIFWACQSNRESKKPHQKLLPLPLLPEISKIALLHCSLLWLASPDDNLRSTYLWHRSNFAPAPPSISGSKT